MAYYSGNAVKDPALGKAGNYAREKKLGILSPKCIQETNPDSQTCVIKGNLRIPGNGNKTYKWFCTEAQAKKEGFIKGADCFAKTWD